ncbi:MAG: transglycosylase SLT domain-containing protein [Gemmatimonadaceae bacterium]
MITSHRRLLLGALGLCAAACHSPATKPELAPQSAAAVASAAPEAPPTYTSAAQAKASDTAIIKSAEVVSAVAGVFGDTGAITPLIDAIPTAGPTWDIDVRSYEGQERVAFYVNLFTQSSRSRFQERLHQGTRYEPMIRAKLKAGGIPEDMTYLAMVESGYDPNAYSSAAAVGMWQFMSSTARDVGLRVDWWVDERRDPALSTDAAIRFLRDLQNQFGSLYLAAAAYNGGPGRVSRGLTRFAEEMEGAAGEDRFFALAEHDYLRSETKNYVPQIIAAALVGKEPVRYGFAYDTLAQYAYDSVEVAAGTPLSAGATASAVDLSAIKELNPAVLRGMVPPTGSMWLRIPQNGAVAATEFGTALAALSEGERAGYHAMKSTGSESAASVASKAGITASQLAWYNPGLKSTKKGKLIAGQSVRVPTVATVAAASIVPDPSIERYGSSTVAATRGGSVHIVKRGESLGRIAVRYGVSVARLKSLNGMRGDKVLAGQALRVKATPVSRTTKSNARAVKKTATRAVAPKKKSTAATSTKKSTVKKSSAKTKKVAAQKAATPKKGSSR